MTNVVVRSNIVDGLQRSIRESKYILLKEIAEEFSLDLKYLEKKYLSEIVRSKTVMIEEKKKYNSDVLFADRCEANTRKGAQCIKSKVDGCCYCQIHKAWKSRHQRR